MATKFVLTEDTKAFIFSACGSDVNRASEIIAKAECAFNCEQSHAFFRIREMKKDKYFSNCINLSLDRDAACDQIESDDEAQDADQ